MNRALFPLALAAILASTTLLTSDARAVEVAVLTPTTVTVAPGASFTIELAIDNAQMDPVNGILVHMTGLAGNANAISGVAADTFFNVLCTAALGCLDGVDFNYANFWDPRELVNTSRYDPGDDEIQLASAIRLSDVSHTGATDPGITYVPGIVDPRNGPLWGNLSE